MSIRSEIRAALVAQGALSCDEMLQHVPAVNGIRATLQQNLSQLAGVKMIRRAGLSDDGKPLYQLDDWPERASDGTVTPPTRKPAAKTAKPAKAAKKTTAPKAAPTKAPRKSAAKKPRKAVARTIVARAHDSLGNVSTTTARAHHMPPSPGAAHLVGLQANGDAIVVDKHAGSFQVIAAGAVQQLLEFAHLRPRA